MRAFAVDLYQIEVVSGSKRNLHDREPRFSFTMGSKMKFADVPYPLPTRTVFKRAKSNEAAKNWAERFGTVIKCFKIDTTHYLENIEHLNLNQKPPEIELSVASFIVNKNLEVTRQKESKYNIQLT